MPRFGVYYGKLMARLEVFETATINIAKLLGKAVFNKTRYANHLTFLRTCLQKDIIPNGFRIKHHTGITSHDHRSRLHSITRRCSQQLIRAAIQNFEQKKDVAHSSMEQYRLALETHCVRDNIRSVKLIIHQINHDLHSSLQKVKTTKLEKLLPSPPPHRTIPDHGRTVVTIPADLQLSEAERSVLSKGLKFVPTRSKPNWNVAKTDVTTFYRRLRLHAHFNSGMDEATWHPDMDENRSEFDKFKKTRSTWTPPAGSFPGLDLYIAKCQKDVERIISTNQHKTLKRHNVSKAERSALKSLSRRTDVVVKPADKGGAVVAWDKNLYLTEAQRQLSDPTYYQPLSKDITKDNAEKVEQCIEIEISNGNLPPEATNLIVSSPKCSKFYLVPKIHKPDTPGRPIVSACSCPTEHISEYVDNILQPLVHALPTYVKDTTNFLQILDRIQIPHSSTGTLLFTLDVKSLYTTIPNNDGLEALRIFLDHREVHHPPTTTIIRLTELVLTLNCFEFNESYYQQIGGVSMGTHLGPSYACLFMGHLEKKILDQYSGPKPCTLLRFIDDYFGIAQMHENELKDFIQFANDFHPSIQLTHTVGKQVEFLDCSLTLLGNSINTSIHYKPTDAHTYLNFESSHPPKCKQSIPYSQLLRLRKICSDDADYGLKSQEMSSFFLARGYPQNVVTKALQQASDKTRAELLHATRYENTNSRIPLVLTYHPGMNQVKDVIYRNFYLLQDDPEVGTLFTHPPLLAYRRDTSIQDMVVHSKVTPGNTGIPGTFTCGRNRCITCHHVSQKTNIIGPKGNFQIKQHFTCITTGVVYCIECQQCGELYIGETGRRLGDRFRQHVYNARKKLYNTGEVAKHFNKPGHSYTDMTVSTLLQVSDTASRKQLESNIILRLGTVDPLGMNEQTN